MSENERAERKLDIVVDLLVTNPEITDEQLELFLATADVDSPTVH